MQPKRPVYWVFSDWILSGVCSVVEDLIRGMSGCQHQVVIMRPEESLTVAPSPGLPLRCVSGLLGAWDYLRCAPAGIVVNSFDWQLGLLGIAGLSHHRWVQVLHGDEPYYYEQVRCSPIHWDLTISVSAKIADAVRSMGVSCHCIPNGVSRDARPRVHAGPRPRVLYGGRFEEPQKRVRSLPALFDGLGWEVHLAGAGPEEAFLRSRMPDANFHGVLSRDEYRSLCLSCDFVVMISRHEGFGLSLLEAMHAGCVPIMTPWESDLASFVREQKLGLIGDLETLPGLLREFPLQMLSAWQTRVRSSVAGSGFDAGSTSAAYSRVFSAFGPPRNGFPGLRTAFRLCKAMHQLGRFPLLRSLIRTIKRRPGALSKGTRIL